MAILVLAVLASAAVIVPKLHENYTESFEKRAISAVAVTESALRDAASDFSDIRLYTSKLERAGDTWQLTGVLSIDGVGDFERHASFQASLGNRCDGGYRADCWVVVSLNVDSERIVDAGEQVGVLSALQSPSASDDQDNAIVPAGTAVMADQQNEADAMTSADATAPPNGSGSRSGANEGDAQIATGQLVESESEEPSTNPGEPEDDVALVLRIQRKLAEVGYDPGPIDGVVGPQTASAIQAYQRQEGFPVDGEPTTELLESLEASVR